MLCVCLKCFQKAQINGVIFEKQGTIYFEWCLGKFAGCPRLALSVRSETAFLTA